MLLYAALSMIVEIEKAFNQIAEAPTGKTWIKRITHYWTLLTLGPILLVAGFAVAQGVQPLLKDQVVQVWGRQKIVSSEPKPVVASEASVVTLPEVSPAPQLAATSVETKIELSPVGKVMLDILGSLIAIPISMITLMILFTSVPNKRIDFRAALWGGLGAAVLWELSKWGLVGYIKYSSSYARLYGVIALLPLFLLWVYVTWIIVLLGFQVAVTLQTFRVISKDGFKQSVMMALGLVGEDQVLGTTGGPRLMGVAGTLGHLGSIRVLDHGLPLRAMVVVADRFAKGQHTDLQTLTTELRADENLVKSVAERLMGAGLLHQIAVERAPTPCFVLAKPSQVILASEVFGAGEDMLEGAADKTTITNRLRDARLTAFRGVTLADLVAQLAPPPQQSDPMMPGNAALA
jgi:uncharacterized BrkB/YihY/UPF0761 family membrane protein